MVLAISNLLVMMVLLRNQMLPEMRKDKSTMGDNEELVQLGNDAESGQGGVQPFERKTVKTE